jgi:hypothetical protein
MPFKIPTIRYIHPVIKANKAVAGTAANRNFLLTFFTHMKLVGAITSKPKNLVKDNMKLFFFECNFFWKVRNLSSKLKGLATQII